MKHKTHRNTIQPRTSNLNRFLRLNSFPCHLHSTNRRHGIKIKILPSWILRVHSQMKVLVAELLMKQETARLRRRTGYPNISTHFVHTRSDDGETVRLRRRSGYPNISTHTVHVFYVRILIHTLYHRLSRRRCHCGNSNNVVHSFYYR